MKRDISWLRNRLLAMSPAEIIFRVSRACQGRLDKLLYQRVGRATGWLSPKPATVASSRGLFPEIPDLEQRVTDRALTRSAELELLMNNRLKLFSGGKDYFIGDPVQWRRDPKTETLSPAGHGLSIDYRDDRLVGDVKHVWELGRQQFLVPLCIDSLVHGDPDIRNKLEGFIDSWLEQNPPGEGIHWCSALEVSLRLVSWSVVHSILVAADRPKGIFGLVKNEKELGYSIEQHVRFVMRNLSRHSSANNHLIGELVGVWTACNVFNLGTRGKQWAKKVQQELETQAKLQNHDDGVNKEQAIYYHLWVLEYLWFCWLIGKRYEQPFSDNFELIITRMASFLKDIGGMEGNPPNIGDADGGLVVRFTADVDANPFAVCLDSIVCSLKDTEESDSGDQSRYYLKSFWYRSMLHGRDISNLNNQLNLDQPIQLPAVYPDGGYYLLGDKQIKICFKCSELGFLSTAAHGHADALSLTIAYKSRWWLTDQGTYTYRSDGGWRDYFRGTSAHNTISVSGENQSTIGGPFLWTRRAICTVSLQPTIQAQSVAASHDGYSSLGVLHNRQLSFTPISDLHPQIVVSDRLTCKEGAEESDIEVWYHFHPDVFVKSWSEDILTLSRGNDKILLQLTLPAILDWNCLNAVNKPVRAGWYSESFDKKQACISLLGKGLLNREMEFRTIFEFLDCSHNT
ncbi:MAG: heparinase II/III family protein [Acidiferrobacterales bacterium]|nr:heparinase II/III family protein [Acidiferrobacterales bacterium]